MLIVPHRAFVPPAGLLAREGLRRERGLYVPDRRIRRAITVTNINTGNASSASSVTITAATVAAGSLVIVIVQDSGTSTGSVTDTASGNVYALVTSIHPNNSSANGTTQIFWSVLASGLTAANSIKYTSSGTPNLVISACSAALPAGWPANPVDTAVTTTNFGSGTAITNTTGGVPAQAGELVIAVVGAVLGGGSVPTLTNGTGFNTPPNASGLTSFVFVAGGSETNAGSSAPQYNSASISASHPWGLILASFKADFPMPQILM